MHASPDYDCRNFPSEKNCTVAISADSKQELVEAAAQHAVAVHGHADTPELRAQLAKMCVPVEPMPREADAPVSGLRT